MILLLMSDIHGNLAALQAVLQAVKGVHAVDACVLLGDAVDYGIRTNEVIQQLRRLPYPALANIRGNHEDAVLTETYDRFSSERGRQCCQYTRRILTADSWQYLREEMAPLSCLAFEVEGKRCLAVHGSLEDNYWGVVTADGVSQEYSEYDYVFSGHSHVPQFFEEFFVSKNPATRNQKKTLFINPGSVGQPRNLNNRAQYAIFDVTTEMVLFGKAAYNIEEEQNMYHGQVDLFYQKRLILGI